MANVGAVVSSIRNIMRQDRGISGDAQRLEQLGWMLFLKIIDDKGEMVAVEINEGDIYLLPAKVPHSPQRKENTVGLVIEYPRSRRMLDALEWYCENCGNQLYREEFKLDNIETDMPIIFDNYYSDVKKCTCDSCGTVMEVSKKIK